LLLTTAGLRLREASTVLDPQRVSAMLAELGADELRKGLEGLALLAEAANRRMARQASRKRGTRVRE
jgi:hypothetical protein